MYFLNLKAVIVSHRLPSDPTHAYLSPTQWRRNEFESGGNRTGANRRKNFLVVSLHSLALKAQLVVLVSHIVMVSTV